MTAAPSPLPASLSTAACAVINDPAPAGKVARTRAYAAAWRDGAIGEVGSAMPSDRPARPARPELRPPREMPRRRKSGLKGRLAFVHAIAHIEFNAIDLAWDLIARFTAERMPRAFFDDWVGVALDEAEHFDLLCRRMAELGGGYGDLPAHDGLWEAATNTADDLLARLALVPMVLEARGLDTTPGAVARLTAHGDAETARLLAHIGEEEIPHVAAGVRWFEFLAARRGVAAHETFHALIHERFDGNVKPPFNAEARTRAGMAEAYYAPYAAEAAE